MKKIIIVIVTMPFFLSGCIKFYSYKEYEVKVVDYESSQPVEGAEVSVRYLAFFLLNYPETKNIITNDNGWAKIKVANKVLNIWEVNAEGYQFYHSCGVEDDGRVPVEFFLNENKVIIPVNMSESNLN